MALLNFTGFKQPPRCVLRDLFAITLKAKYDEYLSKKNYVILIGFS